MTTDSGSTVGVKTGELGKLGSDISRSAAAVKDQVKKVSDNMIGSAEVGRNYADKGKKIQTGLEAIRKWLEDWAEAGTLTGDGVGASAVMYSDVDKENATTTSKTGS
ncbi:hypothetical protein [Nocardia cyriacigeorgica]|uniref:hypothetical protein n=1 Tax=Nocardia cyriacigeorgica TaxID=135487 RepID=UPI00189632DD|nr:hypothetical protein [Nocardia cyriacigeorgica]MBF6416680.1 hypothetical protein [Nocardia cyriacigeorgica]